VELITHFSFDIWVDPALKKPKKGEPAVFSVRTTISLTGPVLGEMRPDLKDRLFQSIIVTARSAGMEG
jgi:hypothetical protein